MIQIDNKVPETRESPYEGTCTCYPSHFVLECECGSFLFYAGSSSICRCGLDHTDLLQELESLQVR